MSNPMNIDPSQGQRVEIDLEAYVATLTSQRNGALDAVAQQQGVIAKQQKQIAELEQQIAQLKPPGALGKPHLVDQAASE